MTRSLVCCLALAFLPYQLDAQQISSYLNPGVRFAYVLGEKGATSAGFELSYTRGNQHLGWGVLASVDWCDGRLKAHLAGQISRGIGISVGPSLTRKDDEIDYGLTATPFAGFILYPFYAYTWRASSPDIQEAGAFVKIPFRTSGEQIRFGN